MAFRWTELVLGLWVLISPWVLGFSTISLAKWSSVLVGIILVLAAVWERFGGKSGGMPDEKVVSK